ncbi:hypothetical protein Csac_1015 [Caldicellulosiruptor saccharolyticus DSM 8903]|uniref:DUF3800 domain-containing protein n=1 Tax=Caldicellulosiruptor saccharolyticus (strain ATCC 43494 / DSM 8903 / Tp8T 6331) TaxID=351627 RepID=A4XI94_CALS8|nr:MULTISPECIES: DUF3800 domain-containing protein [Caldicellulosiruptor]ABP66629.1 hypothetical protein Csac_1015 [Caldicellulosiruptor saccharolyticus DSM 8903]
MKKGKLPLIHIYCDESSQNKNRYMIIGGLWVLYENLKEIEETIKQYRTQHNMYSELKWGKVSKGKLVEYKKLVDIIFKFIGEKKMAYRCIVVDLSLMDNKKYNKGDEELGFYKMYYQLLLHYINPNYRYIIYPDDRKNSYKYRLQSLQIILNRGLRKKHKLDMDIVRHIEARKSHEVDLIQATDILTGAIGFHWNDMDKKEGASSAKKELALYIAQKAGLATLKSYHRKDCSMHFHIWYCDFKKSKKVYKTK